MAVATRASAIPGATYQKILTNSTEGAGTFATMLSTFKPNVLKYVSGDSNISITNGISYNGSSWVNEHVLVQLLPAITCDTLNATTGLISNSITIGGSTSSATVAVTGSGAFSQDLSAKSIKLTGAQLPIVNTLEVAGAVSMPGYMLAAGMVSATGTKIMGTGQVIWTVSRVSTGVFQINFLTPHPLGANYIIGLVCQGGWGMIRSTVVPTSTFFKLLHMQ